MKTLLEVFNLAVEFLTSKGIKNPRREVQLLFSHALDVRPLDLYVQFDRPLLEIELALFRSYLLRRAKNEPYQYICGKVDFFDCRLDVNEKVLIPRQETEILVDTISKELTRESVEGKILWDLCCGSGCIGIALKKRFPGLTVILSDRSEEALDMAESNAKQNDVKVSLRQGDFLHPFAGERAHYITCNPPYVSEQEFAELDAEVRCYEPKLALVAEDDGLAFYKRLATDVKDHLFPQGKVWLEIGHRQGAAVQELFKGAVFRRKQLAQDWSGSDRFFFLENE